MKRIVWDQSARVIDWVSAKTGEEGYPLAVGIGLEKNGELIAGVVFNLKAGKNILMHVASDGSRHWMTPAYMAACFRYAFIQEGCNHITGLVRSDNSDAQHFDEGLGFVKRGLLPKACDDGADLIIYGMLKEECRFLDGKYHAALLESLRS
ncbi:hypothetical protein PIN31009_01900 [Pandoraea iniqua]|jgi:RimJ/RimL family protein N-acetyltransferase|uniref:GNAT family N-acetyltransferase n=1 Tax=Pandoraea iniqua TaxID=2508288 RepID=UPI0012415D0F|nr:GNAT family protein [Pandoraea iniqua]VVD96467.1 hypothetical protein PIN31009_01900 [Pandoraea iniqua]